MIPNKDIEVIEWLDHFSVDVWVNQREFSTVAKDFPIVHSIGWVVKETPDAVLLCCTFNNQHQSGHLMNILKGTIKSRMKVELP